MNHTIVFVPKDDHENSNLSPFQPVGRWPIREECHSRCGQFVIPVIYAKSMRSLGVKHWTIYEGDTPDSIKKWYVWKSYKLYGERVLRKDLWITLRKRGSDMDSAKLSYEFSLLDLPTITNKCGLGMEECDLVIGRSCASMMKPEGDRKRARRERQDVFKGEEQWGVI